MALIVDGFKPTVIHEGQTHHNIPCYIRDLAPSDWDHYRELMYKSFTLNLANHARAAFERITGLQAMAKARPDYAQYGRLIGVFDEDNSLVSASNTRRRLLLTGPANVPDSVVELEDVASAERPRSGFCKFLVDFVADDVWNNIPGCDRVEITTRLQRTIGIRFWKAAGFKKRNTVLLMKTLPKRTKFLKPVRDRLDSKGLTPEELVLRPATPEDLTGRLDELVGEWCAHRGNQPYDTIMRRVVRVVNSIDPFDKLGSIYVVDTAQRVAENLPNLSFTHWGADSSMVYPGRPKCKIYDYYRLDRYADCGLTSYFNIQMPPLLSNEWHAMSLFLVGSLHDEGRSLNERMFQKGKWRKGMHMVLDRPETNGNGSK